MSVRTFWRAALAEDSDTLMRKPKPAPESEANLVASLTEDGKHMPAIDLDVPARLVDSSTPYHSHLYIDRAITWDQYVALLNGFRSAGLIEEGFYASAMANKATHLRTHKKGERES